jgi:hypothetical protein
MILGAPKLSDEILRPPCFKQLPAVAALHLHADVVSDLLADFRDQYAQGAVSCSRSICFWNTAHRHFPLSE